MYIRGNFIYLANCGCLPPQLSQDSMPRRRILFDNERCCGLTFPRVRWCQSYATRCVPNTAFKKNRTWLLYIQLLGRICKWSHSRSIYWIRLA